MQFTQPAWFMLLPILLVAGLYWRQLRLLSPLRFLIMALLVTALAGPQIRALEKGLDLYVLVDRSNSAEDSMAPIQKEWLQLIREGQGPADNLRLIDFAEAAMIRDEGGQEALELTGQFTRTALALEYALGQVPAKRVARFLLLTDGYSTEPLGGIGERLLGAKIPLDYRLTINPDKTDYRVTRLKIRERVQSAEPFLIEIDIAGQPDGEVPLSIFRNGQLIAESPVEMVDGQGQIRFRDRLTHPGAHRYIAEVSSPEDEIPGNNRAAAFVELSAGPRVLLLTNYQEDPLAKVLADQGFAVEVVTETETVGIGRLVGTKAVILNNVPAFRLSNEMMEGLDFYVREQGGGLLMTGGAYSFGRGGYYKSPVDDLLPVSLELRQEQRRLATTMAIVMDRSGSMGMTVRGGETKMDLANAGASGAVELLGGSDLITIFAVDSSARRAVPLMEVGPNRRKIVDRTRKIDAGGGGIFVYTGLKAAWDEIKGVKKGQKHIILFSDAMDSEEPGEYQRLIGEMVQENTTVSVIGLGTKADADAGFLEDIARRGNGRIFFNTDARSLPALFAQETVAVARSAFIEEPVALTPTSGWFEIAAGNLDWLTQVDAFNLCYPKEGATQAAVTGDKEASPLVSFCRKGTGRTAAVCFPLGGEFSESVRNWSDFGDFGKTLTRWLMGDRLPPGINVRTEVEGEYLRVELQYTNEWEQEIARRIPELVISRSGERETTEVEWERISPGRYVAQLPLTGENWLRGAVQLEDHIIPFGPISPRLDVEWQFDRDRLQELRTVSAATNGEERLDLSKAWIAPVRDEFRDVRVWFFIGILALFLIEALASRLGWRSAELASLWKRSGQKATSPSKKGTAPSSPALEPSLGRSMRRAKKAVPPPQNAARHSETATPRRDSAEDGAEPEKAESSRSSRFSKAKLKR